MESVIENYKTLNIVPMTKIGGYVLGDLAKSIDTTKKYAAIFGMEVYSGEVFSQNQEGLIFPELGTIIITADSLKELMENILDVISNTVSSSFPEDIRKESANLAEKSL